MLYQPEVNYPDNVDLELPEGYTEKDIETNSPNQEVTEQEYNRSTEKHYKDNPE